MSTFTIETAGTVLEVHRPLPPAELAAAAFLARYRGRTLDSYKHDLRTFFAWADQVGMEVLAATRPQLELYVRHLEEAGLAPSTIDRRISTICGFYRFAHVDGVIGTNPAEYVRRPKVHPSDSRGLDRGGAGRLPAGCRALRRRPCRPGRAVGPQRASGLGGLLGQHRRDGLRTGSPGHCT